MAGLIRDSMKFDHAAELKKMRSIMPKEMQDGFERVVLAGKKILYSNETREMVDKFLNSDAEVAEKLGLGVANVMILIDNKANGNIPKEVIIPAATVLLFDAADFLRKTGEKVTAQDIGMAYEMMFFAIFEAYGMAPDQVEQVFDKMGAEGQEPQPEEEMQ